MVNTDQSERQKQILRTSFIGIGANILLVIFKALVGAAANSIALILDAVNNLSDVLSSVVTVIGTKLAAKKPDKKHPYGHGRAEYMSQLIVAAIVLYAGITAVIESVKKIIYPEPADHTFVSLIVIGAAIAIKIFLGLYFRKKGKETESGALVASGTDALSDAVISVSVFVSALVYMITGFSIEAYVGVLISLFILKAGFEIISEAVDEMIGHRPDSQLAKDIRKTIAAVDDVKGVYDLIIHNYGPGRHLASAHIEVDSTLTADRIDVITRSIQRQVYEKHGVIMTAVGIYSKNTGDSKAAKLRDEISKIVMSFDGVLQIHGFFLDEGSGNISFDVVIDFLLEREEIYSELVKKISDSYPDYHFTINLDNDMSD